MADDPKAPTLNLTPEEKRVFGQLFRQADTENIGVVTGEVAVKFFENTRLNPNVLGEIWQIADTENRGLLTPAGFGIVLRLIGHYQAGRNPTAELALRPGPLPKFDGGPGGPNATIQAPPGPPPSALQPQSSGSGPIRVPPLTLDKVNQYAGLFEKSGAVNGVLPGEQAKQIFERAGLPNEILGRIWMLSDTEGRGALVMTEFVIAMHLLASFKSGAMRTLPNVLPAGLYEAATRRTPSRQGSGGNAISTIPRQFSGVSGGRAASPLSRSAYGSPQQQIPQGSGMGNDWAITPSDKVKFDNIFAQQDISNKGYITGEEAVGFFSESKLPEEALAQIWDLADINSTGQLTRDEFAVAMYLIRQQRGRRDGRDSLPATLPPNLVPPSMRGQIRAPPNQTAPAFDNPTPALPKSAADDLFGLDALSSPSAPATQVPQSTGGSGSFAPRQISSDPFGSGSPLTPSSPVHHSPQHSTIFKPFAPSSSFGQSLTYNATGGSNNSTGQFPQRGIQPQASSASEDLLGDNDPEISKKLTSETSELANLSNQVGNLTNQMQEVQGQRTTTQNDLTQASSQKREFEIRLAQLRSHYEQEAKDVKNLQERLAASRNETKKLQTDIAMIEATYQDLQNKHQETVTALQADQQENANLKERMRVVNAEIAQMRPSLEKLRSDARQQKGLVAINKKQLATNEQERDKLKTEAAELAKSIEEDTQTLANASRVAQSQPLVASPALSTASANNPFFRRQGSTSEISNSPYASSPIPHKQSERSFEDVFGPSFGAAAANHENAPSTSFRPDGISSPAPNSTRDISGASVPPPPELRQMSSSFLPFPAGHDESISSSRQVSVPNSRFGEGSTGAETPANNIGATHTGSSIPGHVEEPSGASPDIDRNSTASPAASESRTAPTSQDSIPGAFPGDVNSHLMATPTGGSNFSEQAAADPFAMTKEPVRSATTKDDFDAAFAGFGGAAKKQESSATGASSNDGSASGAPTGFSKEFPPIAELEHDDDSDSASEGGGFDDDFTSASPAHTRKISSPTVPSLPQQTTGATSNGTSDLLSARPGTATGASATSLGTDPPTPGAQASPPSYDKTVSPGDETHADLNQYSGLIPKREDPTSPPPADHAITSPHEANQTQFVAPQTSAQPVPPAKVPFDNDFDDEFDDLEDAKEGDLDDDFANLSVHDRSGMDDFNAVFDSPPVPPKSTSQSDDFGSGNSGFGDFTQSPHPMQQQPTTSSAINDNNDWDAIFAGLDQPATDATEVAPEAPQANNGTGLGATSAERPQLGRALTEAGEHDDPILKNLTGMGYARTEALAALEKYDYNLERAANYLASQS